MVSFEVGGPLLISLRQFMTRTIIGLRIQNKGSTQRDVARVIILGMTWMLRRLQTSIPFALLVVEII